MATGLLKLKTKGGRAVAVRRYYRYSDFKKIVDYWRSLYRYEFEKYYVHALPDIKKPK
jgi:hypothetical protein